MFFINQSQHKKTNQSWKVNEFPIPSAMRIIFTINPVEKIDFEIGGYGKFKINWGAEIKNTITLSKEIAFLYRIIESFLKNKDILLNK